tara:strand:+ start:158 stop:406 length:249 start_codon:yes stop_codon:yes gene_type:complete
MNGLNYLPKIGAGLLAFAGIVYEMGRHSQKIGDLIPRVYAMEEEIKETDATLFEIFGKLSSIEEKVINMEKEVNYIRTKLDK